MNLRPLPPEGGSASLRRFVASSDGLRKAAESLRKPSGLRAVRGLKPDGIIWDLSVTGFAARRQRGEAVTYLVYYRTAEGRQRWHTIGRHGAPWTPEGARREARRGS